MDITKQEYVIALEKGDGIIEGNRYKLIEIDEDGLFYYIIDESGEELSYHYSCFKELNI